jgi:nitrate/nitrite transport system ATP-binding protein
MTKGPRARIGDSIRVPFARPRARAEVLDDPRYYPLREHLLEFLAAQEGH